MSLFSQIFVVISIILIVCIICYYLYAYNLFVRLINNIDEAWSNVSVALNKRHVLIDRLIKCATQYSEYEQHVQEAIAISRDGSIDNVDDTERQLNRTMIALVEAQPELLASKSFLDLGDKLIEIENDIQGNRLVYNRAVALYNSRLRQVPYNLFGYSFGFIGGKFFEFESTEGVINGKF